MTLSGTSLEFIPIGLFAAMCIATSLAAASEPSYSTITPKNRGKIVKYNSIKKNYLPPFRVFNKVRVIYWNNFLIKLFRNYHQERDRRELVEEWGADYG